MDDMDTDTWTPSLLGAMDLDTAQGTPQVPFFIILCHCLY